MTEITAADVKCIKNNAGNYSVVLRETGGYLGEVRSLRERTPLMTSNGGIYHQYAVSEATRWTWTVARELVLVPGERRGSGINVRTRTDAIARLLADVNREVAA